MNADAQAQALIATTLSIKIARREAAPDDVVGQRLLGFLGRAAVLEDFVRGAELEDLPQRVLREEGEHLCGCAAFCECMVCVLSLPVVLWGAC